MRIKVCLFAGEPKERKLLIDENKTAGKNQNKLWFNINLIIQCFNEAARKRRDRQEREEEEGVGAIGVIKERERGRELGRERRRRLEQ